AFDARNELAHQAVGGVLAHRHSHGDSHASFARGAVSGTDERVHRLVHVRVRHDDHVVLGATERLYPFAVRGAVGIDVFAYGGRANKPDGLDVGVLDDGVHGFLVAVHHVQDARRQAGLDHQ